MAKQDALQQAKERALATFEYLPETGQIIRKLRGGGTSVVGAEAGCYEKTTGYRALSLAGKKYWSHRMAWLLFYGEWPTGQIDHINGDKLDNRIENLRQVCNQQNAQNVRKARGSSASGLLGAHIDRRRNKWNANIVVDGRMKYLGSFDTAEEAHKAYMSAKPIIHAGFVA